MAKNSGPPAPVLPPELWRELYSLAARFQTLAPWRWMNDDHVLGIENKHGIRLVCVMGGLGEVFGLASYRGGGGANFLLRMLRGEFSEEHPDTAFAQDAIVMDFNPREDLRPEDRALLRQTKFKPSREQPGLFPQFYSHRPGYVPWFIDEAEGRLVADDLGKVLSFARLIRADPGLYRSRKPFEFPFFPASPAEPLTPGQLDWHILYPVPRPVEPPVDPTSFDPAALVSRPQQPGVVWELTAFFSSFAIGEAPRPYWSKLSLMVEARTGSILGFKTGGAQQTMAETAARNLADCVKVSGFRPGTIRVESASLAQELAPLAAALGIKIHQVDSLPHSVAARRSAEAAGRRAD